MDVDKMLAHAGDFGRYQLLLLGLFSINNILCAFHYFGQIFITVEPIHHCHIPGVDYEALTPKERLRYWPTGEKSSCYRYQDSNITNPETLIPCDNKWDYILDYGYPSIVPEMNWVCEDDWKTPFTLSMFFAGSVIGTLVFGYCSDRIGRLNVLVASNLLALFGNLITTLTENVYTFGACRFFAGMATDTNFVMFYIIVLEYLRPSKRTLGLNLIIGIFYTMGCMAVPWLAVSIGHWRHFLIYISIPLAFVPLCYILVPESALWLISKGRIDQAVKCFEKVANINRRHLSSTTPNQFREYASKIETSKSSNLIGLFKTPHLRKKFLILIFKSMVLTLCYDAISRNVNGLKMDPFVMFTLTSTVMFPACLVILALQDKMGRKAMASSSLLLTGLFIAAAGTILAIRGNKEEDQILLAVLSAIGRFGVSIAFNSGAQYAAELIPTEVRGQGVAFIHTVGYAAIFFSPYVLYLRHYWHAIPDLILGLMSIMGAWLCLFLPETLNKSLPVTLEDGEAFGEGEGIFEFNCLGTEVVSDSQAELYRN